MNLKPGDLIVFKHGMTLWDERENVEHSQPIYYANKRTICVVISVEQLDKRPSQIAPEHFECLIFTNNIYGWMTVTAIDREICLLSPDDD